MNPILKTDNESVLEPLSTFTRLGSSYKEEFLKDLNNKSWKISKSKWDEISIINILKKLSEQKNKLLYNKL